MTQALNQTALITGGSTGIGAVYADRLAHRGYDLILVARDQAKMEALADRLRGETGRTIEVVRADLTDRADLARVAGRFAVDPNKLRLEILVRLALRMQLRLERPVLDGLE